MLGAKRTRAPTPDKPAAAARKLPSGDELSDLDPVFRNNPHERLDLLRSIAPRYMDDICPEGRLFLTTHADVRAVLCDRRLSKDPRKAPADSHVRRHAPRAVLEGALPVTMIWLDDPEHAAQRALVAQAFTRRSIEARRPRIEAIVTRLLDQIERKETFDVIEDLGVPCPIAVMADVLGLRDDNLAQFCEWSRDVGFLSFLPSRTPQQEERMRRSGFALAGYFGEVIAKKREAPGDDLISGMIRAELDGRTLADHEIAPNCMLMLLAGNLTVTDVIGNGVMLLLQNPDELAKLRAEPALIGRAVEEILRYDPPVSTTRRHVNEAGEVLGCPLGAGGYVTTSLVAANHDPAVFPDPHRFDIAREASDHLAFGGGPHFCLGAALARLELEIVFSQLIGRFPNLRLAGEAPQRKAIYGFRGYESIRAVV